MGDINLSVHPLFFILGFYYAITGEIFMFIILTATAVIHELGHSFVASNLGYRLNKIMLMPFGAIVSGNIEGIKFLDEMRIAIAGPFLNISIGIFFIAMWWIYPESYAYSDTIVMANLSMAIVNLLPIYPLDGGRIVFASLGAKFGYERAFNISKIIGIIFSLLILALFVIGIFINAINISLLFFSLFIFFGAINREKENKYIKIFSALDKEKLKNGAILKTYAVSKEMKIKKLINLLDSRAVNEVAVFDGDKKIVTLSQRRIEKIIEKANIYSTISQNLNILDKD